MKNGKNELSELVGDDFYAVLNIIEQDEEVEEHVTVSVDVVG